MNHPEKGLVLEVSGEKKNLVQTKGLTNKTNQPKQTRQVKKDRRRHNLPARISSTENMNVFDP